MITLKSKPYNAILKGDGTSVFAELEGQPIVGIHYDYLKSATIIQYTIKGRFMSR